MQVLLAFNSLIFSYTLVQATLLVSIHRFANSWMQDAWHKQRKKRGRRRQRRRQEIYFFFKPRILLSISLLWLSCVFVFSLKFRWLQRLLQNETMDFCSWNVGHEDSVEMEQLKSHLRAGRHECQLYFTYSRALFVLIGLIGLFPFLEYNVICYN